jgi:asparagine synthase (glutamine-hydrolysing)
MCGIAGFWDQRLAGAAPELRRRALAMAAPLGHRGPDGESAAVDPAAGVGLGHRRLAVVDLGPTGEQPMSSASGRFVIAYNGEVYNHGELRCGLEAKGVAFRGSSDTEVMLEAIEAWGLEAALRRFVGMFAFALWDRTERTLHLVRDRLGKKPLYWARRGPLVLFASELKALKAYPGWAPELDPAALAQYLRFGYVPSPRSIFAHVEKVPPGHVLTLTPRAEPRAWCYWSLRDVALAGLRAPLPLDGTVAADALESLLREAVRQRMIADVPLGAFLSGGIDSSTVVALMQAESAQPVKTFSIGFRAAGYDEAPFARRVAAHLGTEHTELYLEPREAQGLIPRLAETFDEPFADSSQIPTWFVSRLARQHVTVALSGDGGDEVFAGYNRHRTAAVLEHLAALPAPLRRAASGLLDLPGPRGWERLARLLPPARRPPQPGEKAAKLALVLRDPDVAAAYRRLVTLWEPRELVATPEPASVIDDEALTAAVPGAVERLQLLDMASYLPGDILTKVDRASMAVSLEVRAPLLDHRVVEFAWRLPTALKLRRGRGKHLLRTLLARFVPPALTERPKSGFSLPLDDWLHGPLRDWAEALLAPSALLVDPAPVRAAWRAHLSGERNEQHRLWCILMLQAWLERERSAALPGRAAAPAA